MGAPSRSTGWAASRKGARPGRGSSSSRFRARWRSRRPSGSGAPRALLALGDWPGAREEIRQLQAAGPGHALVLAGLLILGRWAVEHNAFEPAQAIAQGIPALDLAPQGRAYALLLNGEAYRREGQGSEAR